MPIINMQVLTENETLIPSGGLCPFCFSSYVVFFAGATFTFTTSLYSENSYYLAGGTTLMLLPIAYTYSYVLKD